jgi:hypothetical protein
MAATHIKPSGAGSNQAKQLIPVDIGWINQPWEQGIAKNRFPRSIFSGCVVQSNYPGFRFCLPE